MSQESLKKFFEEFETNEALKNQIKEAAEKLSEAEKNDEAKQVAIVAELAKKAGYDFTAEELLEAKEAVDNGDEKLSLDDLDAVAGGSIWTIVGRAFESAWNVVKSFFK